MGIVFNDFRDVLMAHIGNIGNKQPSLFSAIAIGVGSIIGSGWLFASYKAAKFAGPASVLSWVIGAAFAFLLALLLAEIASMYTKETGLFARLLTLSHNRDYGFIISSTNWFTAIIIIPAEAEASMQYLSTAFPSMNGLLFSNSHFTYQGIIGVCTLMLLYGVLNYWGIKLLTRANNLITIIKFVVPVLTAIIIFAASFHPSNFHAYQNTIAPYGYDKIFTAVVTCGIFYSFYGFSAITAFTKELKNPQRNIPLALGGSVIICLIIYILLQISFVGAIDPVTITTGGWHSLDFTSPLAQLAGLLGLNWLALVMYVDAAISPSGTGIIYVGSSARIFTGMAEDGQMLKVFAKEHHKHQVSRLSIFVTLVICMSLVVFFDNWDKIMVVVSVFLLISCLAIPVSFVKLRKDHANRARTFKMPFGLTICYITYIAISYLLTQCGRVPLELSLGFHVVLFTLYGATYYKKVTSILKAFASSWSIFVYLAIMLYFGIIQDAGRLNQPAMLLAFFVCITLNYYFLINQKSYNK